MGFLSVLSMAHQWTAERAGGGDAVIDATAGGGVDTLALARLVGRKGKVYAFDIQREALDRTAGRLRAELAGDASPDIRLLLADHSAMANYIDAEDRGRIAAVMFNLGYLPGGGDPSVITKPDTTLAALETALALLRPGGILTCVLYPGHPGGDAEAATVERWAAELPAAEGRAALYRQPQRPSAPYLIGVERSRSGPCGPA